MFISKKRIINIKNGKVAQKCVTSLLIFSLLLLSSPALGSAANIIKPEVGGTAHKDSIKQIVPEEFNAQEMDVGKNRLEELRLEKVDKGNIGNEKTRKVELKENKRPYVEGEIIVKYKNNKVNLNTTSGRASALNFINSKSLVKKEDLRANNIQVLTIRDTKTVEQKIAELKSNPNVEYVQPNFQYYPLVIDTDDTYKNNLWGLDNTGQSVDGVLGTSDADIDAPEAWAVNEGTNDSVIVAVIDTGVAYNHPDLATNMWDGTDCKDENNAALGDCNYGYDYEDNDKTPLPTTSSHGTHVAGTIAAVKNNSKGTIGVAPNAKIMAIKTSLTTVDNVKSINFAQYNGATVINASWGGNDTDCETIYGYDSALYDAIAGFDGLFIAAAANDATEHDLSSYFVSPSDFGSDTACWDALDNIISVAATDQNDELASFSDYGATSVDVGAPGTNIYSTGFIQEIFTNATLPSFTNTIFTKTSGSWQTDTWDGTDKMAVANSSYVNNDDGILTLTVPQDTTLHGGNVWLSFYLLADIEYDDLCLYDYLSIQVDNNDNDWTEKTYGCGYIEGTQSVNLGVGSSSMRVRFVWHTDDSAVGLQPPVIDEITISNSNSYQFMNGTSMATPHVAGLAALIWGYQPNLLSSQVKNIILTTGDSLPSLDGKTITGKRINAYQALLQTQETAVPVYRFWSDLYSGHFYTASKAERDLVIDLYSDDVWRYECIAYYAYNSSIGTSIPVYRFWSDLYSGHFYTSSEEERDLVIELYSDDVWRYEGVAYYAYNSPTDTTSPVYRFWSDLFTHHFYTASEEERDLVIELYSDDVWRYEGVAYYAETN